MSKSQYLYGIKSTIFTMFATLSVATFLNFAIAAPPSYRPPILRFEQVESRFIKTQPLMHLVEEKLQIEDPQQKKEAMRALRNAVEHTFTKGILEQHIRPLNTPPGAGDSSDLDAAANEFEQIYNDISTNSNWRQPNSTTNIKNSEEINSIINNMSAPLLSSLQGVSVDVLGRIALISSERDVEILKNLDENLLIATIGEFIDDSMGTDPSDGETSQAAFRKYDERLLRSVLSRMSDKSLSTMWTYYSREDVIQFRNSLVDAFKSSSREALNETFIAYRLEFSIKQ